MDRNYQDSLNQDMIQKREYVSLEDDGINLTFDSYKIKGIHLFSHGTRNWQNIASLFAMFNIKLSSLKAEINDTVL